MCFEAKHLAKTLSFRAVFEAPLFDQSQEGACSHAVVRAQSLFNARVQWPVLDDIAPTEFIDRVSSHVAALVCDGFQRCREALWQMSECLKRHFRLTPGLVRIASFGIITGDKRQTDGTPDAPIFPARWNLSGSVSLFKRVSATRKETGCSKD